MLVAIALAGLIGGGLAALFPDGHERWVFAAATLPVLAALFYEIVTSLRRGHFGLDLVAALSMSAALAFGEVLAANVVALMYAGGQLLESFAEGRARREMTALLARVARTAMRYADGQLEEVPIETLVPGDRLLLRAGETLPVDGRVLSPSGALLDESALTGEALPILRAAEEDALSGSTNVGEAFDLSVSRPAGESTYARIVRLVEGAQSAKAPVSRLADGFALWFLGLTLLIAGVAWAASGDHIRALAVLVVATPCPLILALPVALISGMSRAARRGVLIKSSGALERLWGVKTAILDKTGTLTTGVAEVAEIRTVPGTAPDRLLQLAASLDQASGHVMAAALIASARQRGLPLLPPSEVSEAAGAGLAGRVGAHQVVLGGSTYVASRCSGDPRTLHQAGDGATVAVAVDGQLAGIIVLADPLRPDAAAVLAGLRQAGLSRIVLASGDRQEVVDATAAHLPVDVATGDLDPPAKLALVAAESARGPTLMVGDGVNDAPALAAATVGVAMGARGSAASSETADIVILVDQLGRLVEALQVARRTRTIAMQSVFGGLALSILGMLAAALGYLPPLSGALLQEAIDIVVILNALRALL
jgi:heavy metal translocating P-type ATPase